MCRIVQPDIVSHRRRMPSGNLDLLSRTERRRIRMRHHPFRPFPSRMIIIIHLVTTVCILDATAQFIEINIFVRVIGKNMTNRTDQQHHRQSHTQAPSQGRFLKPFIQRIKAKAGQSHQSRVTEHGMPPAAIHIGLGYHNPHYRENKAEQQEQSPEPTFFRPACHQINQSPGHHRKRNRHENEFGRIIPRQHAAHLHAPFKQLADTDSKGVHRSQRPENMIDRRFHSIRPQQHAKHITTQGGQQSVLDEPPEFLARSTLSERFLPEKLPETEQSE